MARSGKGKTLVADKRYDAPKKATPKAPTQRKPRKKKRGLVARFFLFIWRIIWGILWRVTAVGGMVLGCAVLFFVVFPFVEPRLPFNDVTVDPAGVSPS